MSSNKYKLFGNNNNNNIIYLKRQYQDLQRLINSCPKSWSTLELTVKKGMSLAVLIKDVTAVSSPSVSCTTPGSSHRLLPRSTQRPGQGTLRPTI